MRWNSNGELIVAGTGDDGSGKVTAYSAGSIATSTSGATFIALPNGPCNEIVLKNTTGVVLEIKPATGPVSFEIIDREDLPLPVLADSNEWLIRRKDLSNTPVVLSFLRISR